VPIFCAFRAEISEGSVVRFVKNKQSSSICISLCPWAASPRVPIFCAFRAEISEGSVLKFVKIIPLKEGDRDEVYEEISAEGRGP
jgi:hypothetical protein